MANLLLFIKKAYKATNVFLYFAPITVIYYKYH